MPFHDYLERARERIDRRMVERVALYPALGSEIGDHFHGGKRLRAGTALLVRDALFNEDGTTDMVLDLAAAVEFAHGISLMIDDMVDGDAVRRGGPSVQAMMGTSRAMLEAVRLLSIPYSLAAPYGSDVTAHLAAAHEEMVRGALLEMEPPGPRGGMAAYDRLISMKTGRLFGLAARFGALAAGCCEEKASLAEAYGNGLGSVHQIADDIADLREALSAGRKATGSEALLFRCVVSDSGERERAAVTGRLSEEAGELLDQELNLRTRRAQRSARKLVGSVGRCGGRPLADALRPAMLSAPLEIAAMMMPAGRGEASHAYPLASSEDRS